MEIMEARHWSCLRASSQLARVTIPLPAGFPSTTQSQRAQLDQDIRNNLPHLQMEKLCSITYQNMKVKNILIKFYVKIYIYNCMCVVLVFVPPHQRKKITTTGVEKAWRALGCWHAVPVPLVACAEKLQAFLSSCLPGLCTPRDAVFYTAVNPLPWLHP